MTVVQDAKRVKAQLAEAELMVHDQQQQVATAQVSQTTLVKQLSDAGKLNKSLQQQLRTISAVRGKLCQQVWDGLSTDAALKQAQDEITSLGTQLAQAQQVSQSLQQQLTASSEGHIRSQKQVGKLTQQVEQLLSQQHPVHTQDAHGWGRDIKVKKQIEAAQAEATAAPVLEASVATLAQMQSPAVAHQLQTQLGNSHSTLEQQRLEATSMKLALRRKIIAANAEAPELLAQLEELHSAPVVKKVRSPFQQLQTSMLTPKLLHPVSCSMYSGIFVCLCLW